MINSHLYKPLNTVVFRTPLFSQDQPDSFEELFEKLSNSKVKKEFLEALFLTSPVLYKEFEKYERGLSAGAELIKLQLSLFKYYSRMSTRCTPFGLFAGCGVANIGEESKIELSQINKFRSRTRLDMNYVCSLITDIAGEKVVRDQLKYFPNSGLYFSGENIRYTEYNYHKAGRKYFLSEAECSEFLSRILDKAKKGRTIKELADVLVDDDITVDEAKGFIEDLINNQLLVSELEPTVTGDELMKQIIKRLENYKETQIIVSKMKSIERLLEEIDNKPIGRSISVYQNIKDQLSTFSAKYDEKYLFQSDLFISTQNATIGNSIIDHTQNALKVLNRLSPMQENGILKKFREEFYRKYEDEEIPLLQAIDAETGVGFGVVDGQRGDITPLLEGLRLFPKSITNQDVKINRVQALLLKKYEDFLINNTQDQIEITDSDIEGLPENWNDLPDTFSSMIEVIRTERASKGPLIVMRQAGGSSAANLLGRFCYLNEKIYSHVENIVRKEKELNPDKILGEIVHLPESRTGNILMRPGLRNYEIPYLVNSSVEESNVISVNDLMLSCPQGRYIKLRSGKLNKEVLPRLTCAHNFSNYNALPVYHFLSAMQTQSIRGGIGFSWGAILDNKPFLPRVRYGNVILAPAIWNIFPNDIKDIPKIKDNSFFEKAKEFKKERGIPDKVLLVHGDNKLFIDFNQKLSVQMLFSEVKNGRFRLEEFLFDEKYPLVYRGGEVFTNQVILGFYKDKK